MAFHKSAENLSLKEEYLAVDYNIGYCAATFTIPIDNTAPSGKLCHRKPKQR
jgi:hypothetical protein